MSRIYRFTVDEEMEKRIAEESKKRGISNPAFIRYCVEMVLNSLDKAEKRGKH